MTFLCRIQFDLGVSGTTMYQYYVVDKDELAKLKKLDYEFEAGCCGQSRCFVCAVEGCSVSYHDHIVLKADAWINFFDGADPIIHLNRLLDVV